MVKGNQKIASKKEKTWKLSNSKQISLAQLSSAQFSSVQFTLDANRYPESPTVTVSISLWSTLWLMLSHRNHPSTDPKTTPPTTQFNPPYSQMSYFIQLNFCLYVWKWASTKANSKHFLKKKNFKYIYSIHITHATNTVYQEIYNVF